MTKLRKVAAFTIIELLISTSIFSLIATSSTLAVVQLGRIYRRNIIRQKLDEVNRTMLDDISSTIRFGAKILDVSSDFKDAQEYPATETGRAESTGHFCIGNKIYTYRINRTLAKQNDDENKKSRHVLWESNTKYDGSNCAAADLDTVTEADGRELLSDGMMITNLKVKEATGSDGRLYQINLSLGYATADLIEYYAPAAGQTDGEFKCKPKIAGNEFCTFISTTTATERRINGN